MNMTFGDIIWDLTIAFSNIIFINIAFFNRVKGIKAFCLYFLMCISYILLDVFMFSHNKYSDNLIVFLIGALAELAIMYMCACMAEGDVWRNFTFICTMQILVGALIGIVSFVDDDLKFILYNDGMYRKEAGDLSGYIKISILQIVFSYLVSILLRSVIRKISKKDYIFYKFFVALYCLYAVVAFNFKYILSSHDLEVALIIYIIIQIVIMILFMYFMFLFYNKSIRKKIEKELVALDAENEKIYLKYDEAIAENQKLNNVKSQFDTFVEKVSASAESHESLKKYADDLMTENKEISGNPLTGSLMIDSLICDMENKLKKKDDVFELTIGKSCEELIIKNEKKIAYIIKSIIDLVDYISDNSYVVIGVRNKAHMLFVSINMQCNTEINKKRPLISLANYIRLDKGCCVFKKTENDSVIDILM